MEVAEKRTMKLSEVVQKYVELRDRRAQLKAEYEEQVRRLDEKMTAIEVKLLEQFEKQGVNSFQTEHGTAYVSTRSTASVADREAFLNFVREQNEWPLLEARASKTAVEQYLDAHQQLPPGVNLRTERVVHIRRS